MDESAIELSDGIARYRILVLHEKVCEHIDDEASLHGEVEVLNENVWWRPKTSEICRWKRRIECKYKHEETEYLNDTTFWTQYKKVA